MLKSTNIVEEALESHVVRVLASRASAILLFLRRTNALSLDSSQRQYKAAHHDLCTLSIRSGAVQRQQRHCAAQPKSDGVLQHRGLHTADKRKSQANNLTKSSHSFKTSMPTLLRLQIEAEINEMA